MNKGKKSSATTWTPQERKKLVECIDNLYHVYTYMWRMAQVVHLNLSSTAPQGQPVKKSWLGDMIHKTAEDLKRTRLFHDHALAPIEKELHRLWEIKREEMISLAAAHPDAVFPLPFRSSRARASTIAPP
jgi:hypothetical protein